MKLILYVIAIASLHRESHTLSWTGKPPDTATQCVFEGVLYDDGDMLPTTDPCIRCYASVGRRYDRRIEVIEIQECESNCWEQRCSWFEGIPCVDSIKVDDQCCEICPNGEF